MSFWHPCEPGFIWGKKLPFQLLDYVSTMNLFPRKNLRNAGNESQVCVADRKDRHNKAMKAKWCKEVSVSQSELPYAQILEN